MGLLRRKICPKCGEEYSPLRSDCPNCGARIQSASRRAVTRSDTVRRGSEAQRRQEGDSRWQMIFGLCLVAAVIIAVIVLVVTTVNGGYEMYATPTPSAVEESPTPTPTPTPTPPPTPTVDSVTITYAGSPVANNEFTLHTGNSIQLGMQIYPVDITDGIEWSTSDTAIITVDQTGKVTAVSSGWASVIVRCYGAAAECKVWVPG